MKIKSYQDVKVSLTALKMNPWDSVASIKGAVKKKMFTMG